MIDRDHELPVIRQCELLALARSTAYYQAPPISEADLTLREYVTRRAKSGGRRLKKLLKIMQEPERLSGWGCELVWCGCRLPFNRVRCYVVPSPAPRCGPRP